MRVAQPSSHVHLRLRLKSGIEGPSLPLLAGAHTDIWLEREDLGTSLLLYPGKMLSQGN
jgi:hypothetical protein